MSLQRQTLAAGRKGSQSASHPYPEDKRQLNRRMAQGTVCRGHRPAHQKELGEGSIPGHNQPLAEAL